MNLKSKPLTSRAGWVADAFPSQRFERHHRTLEAGIRAGRFL